MGDKDAAQEALRLLAKTTISGAEYQRRKRTGAYKGSTIRSTNWYKAEELLSGIGKLYAQPPASVSDIVLHNAVFFTGDPISPRNAPPGWKHIYCVDPNPAYYQHFNAANRAASREQHRMVGAWCGNLAKEHSGFNGPGARFARKACEDYELDFWVAEAEFQAALNDALYWGAQYIIGNPNSWDLEERELGTRTVQVPDGDNPPITHTRKTAAQLIKDRQLAYTYESYWNIPGWKPPKEEGAPPELPPVSLTIGLGQFDGGYRSVPEYKANCWPAEWDKICVYHGGHTPDSDWSNLP